MSFTKNVNRRGFTLIEILIVMVIIGLLAALVGPRMFGKVGKSKQKAAKAQISMFETALDTYRLDVGKYPTQDMGLEALRNKPDGLEKWDGPYLPKEIPLDPWGILMNILLPANMAITQSSLMAPMEGPAAVMKIRISPVGRI